MLIPTRLGARPRRAGGARGRRGALPESAPLLLSSPNFVQWTVSANDRGLLNGGAKHGDNWDMNALNENGPQAGRYLFAPYETGTAGVKRLDLLTGQSVTIVPEGAQGFVNGDASRWTPWGTYLTAEESWGAGRRQTSVLKVGDGGTFEGTGAATWVPITDARGNALPGIPTVTAGGVTSVDGRAAADAVGATNLNRPEDLEIQTLADGTPRIYFGTTDTHMVFSLTVSNIAAPPLTVFADQSTIDAATGRPVGSAFMNSDNVAIDAAGNMYWLEDIGSIGATGFDITGRAVAAGDARRRRPFSRSAAGDSRG